MSMNDDDTARWPLLAWLRGWSLWSQPPRTWCYLLTVDLAAALALMFLLVLAPPPVHDVVLCGVLAVVGVTHAELCRHNERLRRALANTPHVDMTASWIFAGVFLLPAALAAVLPLIFYAHLAVRTWRGVPGVHPHRQVFNASAAAVSTLAAASVLAAGGLGDVSDLPRMGWWGIALTVGAVLAFLGVDTALVGVAAYLVTGRRDLPGLLGGWEDNVLELTNIGLGVVTAVLVRYEPALVAAVYLALLFLHRSVLVKQLEVAATTDEKTGLYNAITWQNLASHELARARRVEDTFGVLMVDLDHFKRVNDEHGHLAGDAVLKATAEAVTSAVRDYDSVGRFGGEEFVVLLPGVTRADVVTVAERIRQAISHVSVDVTLSGQPVTIDSVSASIGVAVYPDAGTVVEHLIHAADSALYIAKNTGRNKVVSLPDIA